MYRVVLIILMMSLIGNILLAETVIRLSEETAQRLPADQTECFTLE